MHLHVFHCLISGFNRTREGSKTKDKETLKETRSKEEKN
jgi:hypothetical protein